jgi:hypothetical protein
MHDAGPIWLALMELSADLDHAVLDGGVYVVHGDGPGSDGAPGCDQLVDALVRERYDGFKLDPHPAEKFGRWPGCGPLRNSHMVALGAHVCLAFPCRKSKGTVDCMTKAWKAGIPTRIWRIEP